ncbi:MAG TPA: hypothetical protein VJ715_13955 [Pyrinomonadaceae bacterium]|nr:hypothetical protein [Pyrinomonadaceae bacterium]
MARQKLYPEEFLVRATTEELRLIDELARKSKTSRSRFVVAAALTGGSKGAADLPLFEAMLEARSLALVELRRVRHRLERVADLLRPRQRDATSSPDLDRVIENLAATTALVEKVWAP